MRRSTDVEEQHVALHPIRDTPRQEYYEKAHVETDRKYRLV